MTSNPSAPHLTRSDYPGMHAALLDAHHVLLDLERAADGRLLIAADEYEFLARRARMLVQACIEVSEGP